MKTNALKVNWNDFDDIIEKYQEILLKENVILNEKQYHLWEISQAIREICLNSDLDAEIIIMESPF